MYPCRFLLSDQAVSLPCYHCSQPQLLQRRLQLRPRRRELLLEPFDLGLDGHEVDGLLLLEGVDVEGDVEVVVVLPDLVDRGAVGVLRDVLARAPRPDDLLDVLLPEAVLVPPLLELPARVDEEDGVVLLVPPEEEERRGDAYAVEEVGGEPDHAVEEVLLDEPA